MCRLWQGRKQKRNIYIIIDMFLLLNKLLKGKTTKQIIQDDTYVKNNNGSFKRAPTRNF